MMLLYALVVEWIRQQSSKLFYVGSSPAGSTIYASMALMVAHQTLNLRGLGSSPSRGTLVKDLS